FFFQAEDGIRDATVTGVQTCALPISRGRRLCRAGARRRLKTLVVVGSAAAARERARAQPPGGLGGESSPAQRASEGLLRASAERSEERRVGKECRCGSGADRREQKTP